MRAPQILLLKLLLLITLTSHLKAELKDGQIVTGAGFKGVIFTPKMINDSDRQSFSFRNGDGTYDTSTGLWTPSLAQIQKAEADFRAFLLKATTGPARGANAPTYYSSKYHSTSARYDSDLLYYISDFDTRQYIGIKQKGKNLIVINFLRLVSDQYPDWKRKWSECFIDGESEWVQLRYDPSNGTFTGWENWD